VPTVAFVSFRLGGTDGVSVVAATWMRVLVGLGWKVRTVAGSGPVDVVVPGLEMDAHRPPDTGALAAALGAVDLIVVENLCSLPLNPGATAAVVDVTRGRPAVMHHHDLPWQRERFAAVEGWPATDPAWRHVTINQLTAAQLAEREIEARVIGNAFDTEALPGDRAATRQRLGLGDQDRLVLHPVRAIERKDVPAAVALAERLDATYWLLGEPEEDYAPILDEVLGRARCPVLAGRRGIGVGDAYAACDVVAFPSRWEGFGNPTIESAIHRRPLAVRRYPVLAEIASFGFEWFDVDDEATMDGLEAWLEHPDRTLLDHNAELARRHFSLDRLRLDLADLIGDMVPTASRG